MTTMRTTTTIPSKTNSEARTSDWLDRAHRAVIKAHPTVDFGCQTPQTRAAEAALNLALERFFGRGEGTEENVRIAWRRYYTSCIPL